MAKKDSDSKYKCKLLPFERTDCLSIQEAKQKSGWGITAFDLPKTWEKTKGEDVVIAVLDTGCDLDHPDLKENLLDGINFVETGKLPIDENGHGTHITGILVAKDNDIGMVGVCPKAKVRPVKVLDKKGIGNMLSVCQGIKWAADQGVDLITMSLGAPIKVQQVRKAIQYAESKGTITFCAAGNAGKTEEIFYPANYPESIAVGAINENFTRADFSNTGQNLDFMAPGVDIFSTVPDDWYATLSGTSMACPFAVGVAALMIAYSKKGNSGFQIRTSDECREMLRRYTVALNNIDLHDAKFYGGFGIIDPRKFCEAMNSVK
jgi:subtilisin family serine protease